MRWKTSLLGAALGGAVLLGGILLSGTTAQAANCADRISKQESKLRRDIERHGFFSRQAENDRSKLQSARASCGYGWGRWGSRRGDGDRDRDDGFFRNGRRHHGDGDRDDGFFRRRRGDGDHDRDDRGGWRHGDHDRDHDGGR